MEYLNHEGSPASHSGCTGPQGGALDPFTRSIIEERLQAFRSALIRAIADYATATTDLDRRMIEKRIRRIEARVNDLERYL